MYKGVKIVSDHAARAFWIIFIGYILYCTWLMLQITLPYFSFRYDVDFLLTKQGVLHKAIWRWSFYIHITSSIFVLLFGVFQFIKPLLRHYPSVHKLLGKAYTIIVLFLSAPSGLVMAFYANGGIWAKVSFVIISVLWWVFTWMAYLKIRRKNIASHIAYTLRSYALTLSAITLRTYVVFLPFIIHLHGKEMYVLVSWLSWVPNLIIAEILIARKVFK